MLRRDKFLFDARRGRAAVILAMLVGLSLLSANHASGLGVPDGYVVRDPVLWMGPVSGFTSAPHRAPSVVALPLGGQVEFYVTNVPEGETVSWSRGDVEMVAPNHVRLTLNELGPLELEGAFVGGGNVLRSRINVVNLSPEALAFSYEVSPTRPFDLDELASNTEAVYAFKRHTSIDTPSWTAGGALATSKHQSIRLQAQVDEEVEGLENLVEWRLNGRAVGLGQTLQAPGIVHNTVSVGPPGFAQTFDWVVYSTSILLDLPYASVVGNVVKQSVFVDGGVAQVIPDGVTVTYRAQTDPPGYERLVQWLAATEVGTAEPTLGQGETFTTTFDGTLASRPSLNGGFGQWIGVMASHVKLEQDGKGAAAALREIEAVVSASLPSLQDFNLVFVDRPQLYQRALDSSRAATLPRNAESFAQASLPEFPVVTPGGSLSAVSTVVFQNGVRDENLRVVEKSDVSGDRLRQDVVAPFSFVSDVGCALGAFNLSEDFAEGIVFLVNHPNPTLRAQGVSAFEPVERLLYQAGNPQQTVELLLAEAAVNTLVYNAEDLEFAYGAGTADDNFTLSKDERSGGVVEASGVLANAFQGTGPLRVLMDGDRQYFDLVDEPDDGDNRWWQRQEALVNQMDCIYRRMALDEDEPRASRDAVQAIVEAHGSLFRVVGLEVWLSDGPSPSLSGSDQLGYQGGILEQAFDQQQRRNRTAFNNASLFHFFTARRDLTEVGKAWNFGGVGRRTCPEAYAPSADRDQACFVSWSLQRSPTDDPSGATQSATQLTHFEALTIALHEVGHNLGLRHSDPKPNTIAPRSLVVQLSAADQSDYTCRVGTELCYLHEFEICYDTAFNDHCGVDLMTKQLANVQILKFRNLDVESIVAEVQTLP